MISIGRLQRDQCRFDRLASAAVAFSQPQKTGARFRTKPNRYRQFSSTIFPGTFSGWILFLIFANF